MATRPTGPERNRDKALPRSEQILAMVDSGSSAADIAEAFGVAPGSGRTLIYRARRRLALTTRKD